MAHPMNPCGGAPPKPQPDERARRRALGCPLCELQPGHLVTVEMPGLRSFNAQLISVSATGCTVDRDDIYYFFAWATGAVLSWQPIRTTDVGTHPE